MHDIASSTSRTFAPEIELWFDFGSNYSYLSVMRIEALAATRGVRIRWRPFLLGPVFRNLGFDNSPFVLQKEKGAYVWKDMERQCRKYGLALKRPSAFPRAALLAMRVALLGADRDWIAAYCRKIMQLNFVEDRDIGSAEVVSAALDELGLPAQQIIADANCVCENRRRPPWPKAYLARRRFLSAMKCSGETIGWVTRWRIAIQSPCVRPGNAGRCRW
jgi:2-hydroxychromene-2-carboxylate isomerase